MTSTESRYIGGDKTNLIINYLPQTLKDEEFRNMFLSVGKIKSCRIIRDKKTGYSYGFGFVDYFDEDDAKKAIQTLNGHQVQGKTIKVALARPGGEEIKGANLYIRNLPCNWTKENLDRCFGGFGQIIQSRVLIDHATSTSRRVGFVLFDKKSEAEDAIVNLNGKVPEQASEPIYIKFADDSKKNRGINIPFTISNFFNNAALYQQLSHQNPFLAALAASNTYNYNFSSQGPTRNQTRFRFNPVSSNPSLTSMNSTNNVPGGSNSEDGYVLYVYNIGQCNEKNLWDLFTHFGDVSKVAIVYDMAKGISRGYAFVTMPNFIEAQNAILMLNGYDLFNNGKKLQVSFKNK